MATRLYDGKKIAEIKMCIYDGNGWTPDWSNDFFEIGGLEYDEEHDAYKVQDVDYCIEQAMDWKNSTGDFCEDVPNENNEVFVEIDNDQDGMKEERNMSSKLYFLSDESKVDEIYGSSYPYCMTAKEIEWLSKEWDLDLSQYFHEATVEEINKYGVGSDFITGAETISYDDLINRAALYIRDNYHTADCEPEWYLDDAANWMMKVLSYGDDSDYDMPDGFEATTFRLSDDDADFASYITEIMQIVYDEDGEPEEAIPVGYIVE